MKFSKKYFARILLLRKWNFLKEFYLLEIVKYTKSSIWKILSAFILMPLLQALWKYLKRRPWYILCSWKLILFIILTILLLGIGRSNLDFSPYEASWHAFLFWLIVISAVQCVETTAAPRYNIFSPESTKQIRQQWSYILYMLFEIVRLATCIRSLLFYKSHLTYIKLAT